MNTKNIETAYNIARERYAEYGIDTDKALQVLGGVSISMHCWQADNVQGFEEAGELSSSGLAVTGSREGMPTNGDEMRRDMERAFKLIPGRHRVNLHSIYAETVGKSVSRDELTADDFSSWIAWAKENKLGLDYNGTFFAHPMAADGNTLSHADEGIRNFWIRHAKGSREIGEAFGKALGTPAVVNLWIPDGYKDTPADRMAPRKRLKSALDEIFSAKKDKKHLLDAVESKLFGIGSESYVVGSHEFYMGYTMKNDLLLCLDSGHFHPTEGIADKISSLLLYIDELLLHVSRGVRWDSDHIVILNDELKMIAEELVAADALNRVHIGLDYFDGGIDHIVAWAVGMRAMQQALLIALLTPRERMQKAELAGDFAKRLAYMEENKVLPYSAVWDYFCYSNDVSLTIEK